MLRVHLYFWDVERDCPRADGDETAGDWATSPDSVHDVLLNKKSKAMLVFILLAHSRRRHHKFSPTSSSHFSPRDGIPKLLKTRKLFLLSFFSRSGFFIFLFFFISLTLALQWSRSFHESRKWMLHQKGTIWLRAFLHGKECKCASLSADFLCTP